MKIYVDAQAPFDGDGSKLVHLKRFKQPQISQCQAIKVCVFPGIYRENVNPKHAGTADQRIVYESVEPLKAIITGAEVVKGWGKKLQWHLAGKKFPTVCLVSAIHTRPRFLVTGRCTNPGSYR